MSHQPIMGPGNDLPPKVDFMLNGVVSASPPASSVCTICLDPYNHDHIPVKIATCAHVFGAACLHSWISSTTEHNTCPLCRNVLFEVDDPDAFDSDYYSDFDEETDYGMMEETDANEYDSLNESEADENNIEEDSDSDEEMETDIDTDYFDTEHYKEHEHEQEEKESGSQEQRRSPRIASKSQRDQELHSVLQDFIEEIPDFVQILWPISWELVHQARTSSPQRAITTNAIKDATSVLPWPHLLRLEDALITTTRKMIRQHRARGRFDPYRDLEEYVEHIRYVINGGW